MEFGILGPLRVRGDGVELVLGPPQQRALLAVLLLRRGESVASARLVDELWGERPPATAVKTVQVYVSRLRKTLGDGVLASTPVGYVLRVEPGSLDLDEFERLLDEGRGLLAGGQAREADEALRRALGLWRGQALADFRYEPFARDEIGRLDELRLLALEQRLEADLALGRDAQAVPELEALVREHPLRERLRALLMVGLYRSGRQADALAAYQDARAALVDELGLDPSEELRLLEAAILRHDPSLDLPAVPPVGHEREPRPAAAPRRRQGRLAALAAVGVVLVASLAAAAVLLTRGSPGSAVAAPVSADSVGILDPANGRSKGEIPVGASPTAVATGDGSLWVANLDAHSVSRIDPAKQVVIQTFQVGTGPAGIAFGGGFLWVTNALDGTVTQIDPQTNTVVNPAIPVGNRPSGIAAGRRFVWVANSGDSSVSRISLATGKVVPRTIAVDGGATGIAVGDGSVWVTGQATGNVTRIDERSGVVLGPVHAGSGADAVAVGTGAVWVANTLDGTVTRIDPETNAVASTIPVGDGPSGIAVASGSVWVSNAFAGTLSRIDPFRNVSVQTVTTGNRPQGVVVEPVGLFVAVRASGTGHRGGTLRVLGASGYLGNIDPSMAYLGDEVQVARLSNDGLVSYLKTGGTAGLGLVPDLAVSLPSPSDGGRTYSFQLRPGIRYSTGGVVRPADVRASLERSLEAGGGYDPYFAHIVGASRCLAVPKKPCDLSRGIETDAGSNTVTFHLTAPDPDFLHELTLPPAFVVPVGTPLHGHGFAPATGPYEVDSWNPKTGVRLVRNPRFREWSPAAQPSGLPDVIEERLGGSMDARVAKVLRGDADLALDDDEAPSQAVVESVRTQHAALLKVSPSDGTWYLALNTRVAPFDNLDARKALNLAIDRARLSDLAFGPGVSHVTCQTLPPDFPGYSRYCPYPAAPNLARARKLVRASGTAGQSVTVWGQAQFHIPTAAHRYIVSVLDRLGYKARFRTYPGERFSGGQMAYNGWYPDYAAPAGFLMAVLTCGAYKTDPAKNFNASGFCDPAIDHEIARADALQTTNPEAASRLWAKVDRDLTDRAPWAAFANNSVVEVKSPRVGNYQVNPQLGTLLDQLWVR